VTSPPVNRRLAVLISGRGSNLQALIDAIADGRLNACIAIVISNRDDAAGLERARAAGIEAMCVSHRGWPSRDDFDRALVAELRKRDVGLVCLAGFMRKVGTPLIEAFPNAILNIHPSLLPSFPGLHPQQQALAHGVKTSGVTVHVVTDDLDSGPIVLQRTVPVLEDDTEDTLAARILVEEHRAYPEAVALVLEGGWRIEGRRFVRQPSAAEASRAQFRADN
jgi:phosphoribosylglycinamide formyltransferase-1